MFAFFSEASNNSTSAEASVVLEPIRAAGLLDAEGLTSLPQIAAQCGGLLSAFLVVVSVAFRKGLAEQLFGERRQRRKDAVGVGARNKEREITYADFQVNGKGKGEGEVAEAYRKKHGMKCESDALWIAIHGKVYDITDFADTHPGGDVIRSMVGRDASDVFMAFHMPRVQQRLPPMCVGVLTEAPPAKPATRDYRQLRERLWQEGMFDCDLDYQLGRDAIAAAIFALGLCAILCGASPAVRVGVGGIAVGVALQQVAFTAHDAGHRGVVHPKAGGNFNWWGWLHGTVLFGVSAEMWLCEHSAHHALTMEPCEDPQFNYLPLWLVSKKELARLSERNIAERTLARLLVPIQHFTMIPLSMIIGRFNLHAISICWILKHLRHRPRILVAELLGFALYFTWFGYVVSLLPVVDTPPPATAAAVDDADAWSLGTLLASERFWFLMVSYVTAGILHIQLTISHLALDAFTAAEEEAEQFVYHQLKTTRNINTSWWDDWFHGGLQYQIEHHLFPQLPRHNLARVKPLVMELCQKNGIKYESVGFWAAISYCLADFKRLSYFISDVVRPDEIAGC